LRLDPHLGSHGFARESAQRLRHTASGVAVDVLQAGDPMPRPGAGCYPDPADVAASPDDPSVVDLFGLIMLKLTADRHQDRADVVALLKRLDETAYLALESAQPAERRARLWQLRQDALEEARWEEQP
jgi:hypothetical protein